MNFDEKGWLTTADHHFDSAASAGPFKEPPTLLVMHYTASGGDALADAQYFAKQARDGASAHFVVGREGKLYQCESTKNTANHAGRSVWRGRPYCNQYSIGIEVDNWGILTRRGDGAYYAWTGLKIDDSEVYVHAAGNGHPWTYWETYQPTQLDKVEELTRALLAAIPTIKEIVGHEDVAPGRKTDPGPAFPMKRFQAILSPRKDDTFIRKTVWVDTLNVRAEPATSAGILNWGPLKKNQQVDVMHDAGDWSLVQSVDNGHHQGWVFDRYLR